MASPKPRPVCIPALNVSMRELFLVDMFGVSFNRASDGPLLLRYPDG